MGLQEANAGTQATVGVLLAVDEAPRQRASASSVGALSFVTLPASYSVQGNGCANSMGT